MPARLASLTVLTILKNKKKAEIIISENKNFKNLDDLSKTII